jgi:hypothetical protein
VTIYCHDFESFMNVVYDCITKGLRFDAHTDSLKVILTGGH